jgi:hypothetical protein
VTSKYAGRSTRRWAKIRAQFREWCAKRNEPCWLCGQPIDYELQWPHPMAWSPDHYLTVAEHPEHAEDIGNLRASHFDCNNRRGKGPIPTSLGLRSRPW